MHFETSPAPHVIAGFTVPRVMFQVLLALVPVVLVQVAVFGPGLLLQVLVAGPVALACEALALRARGRDAAPFLRDGSVLVTAALLAVAVPPLLPWWLMALGTAIAVLLGKHVFGGLGSNPFNPAMVGYAALLVSFPLEMTRWPVPFALGGDWDAYTGATALDALRTGLGQRLTMQEIFAGPAFGSLGGKGAQWINLAALAGGLYLLGARPRALAHSRRGAGGNRAARVRDARDRPGRPCIRNLPALLGRDDARRILHRDRPCVGRDERPRPPRLRRRNRSDHLGDPDLGRIPGRHRLRRAADERRGTTHRPLHGTEDPWTRPALNLFDAGRCVRRCCSRQPPSSRWAWSRS